MLRLGSSVAALVLAASSPARAEFIEVDLFDDRPDADLGDGVCDADLSTPGEQHTLRAAIQHANVTPGNDTVSLKPGKFKLSIKGSDEDACATGDLDITDDIVLLGPSSSTVFVDGKKARDRVFDVHPGVDALIFCVTITGGKLGDASGAGLRNHGLLDLHDVVITKCKSAGDAGGLHHAAGSAALSNVWVTKCRSADGAGGIGVDAAGFEMSRSAISKCKAGNEGGGIEFSGNTATLTNVTISGNKAGENGGGISLEDGGTLNLVHCTIALNKAPLGAGIALAGGENACNATNSLFSKNTPLNSDAPIASLGGNLDSGTSCGFGAGDRSSADPKLAKLAIAKTNPPPAVPTHALSAGSPAIGNAAANCEFADARGVPRTQPGPCDSGAYEYESP